MFTTINDLITDEQILEMAQEHLDNNVIPDYGRGKTTLTTRVLMGMAYLINKGHEDEEM